MRLIYLLLVFTSIAGFSGIKPKLSEYKENIYSQWGEDGIIKKIFDLIGTTSKVAIEFGAADGFWFSNTANLWTKDFEWQVILIEEKEDQYKKLKENVRQYNCTPVHKLIGVSSENSLEGVLSEIGFEGAVDILSIDIDGDDYYIFSSLEYLRPRVIICEYNPSIPPYLDVYSDYGSHVGCSVAALQRVASEKGYSLVAITDTNCIFVVNEEYHQFNEYDTDRDHIFVGRFLSYIINDYSGQYKVIGASDFTDPWGWRNRPSPYHYYGDISIITEKVSR